MAGKTVNMVRIGCGCGHVVSVQTAKLGLCPALVNREDAGPVVECGAPNGVVVIVGKGPADPLACKCGAHWPRADARCPGCKRKA